MNLSSTRLTNSADDSNIWEVGWPEDLAPSLERLCAICKDIDSCLNARDNTNQLVVLHDCRGNKERLGIAISVYKNYISICGGKNQGLDSFAMKRFIHDKIGFINVPSYRRYIRYFSALLSASLTITSEAELRLTHLSIRNVPKLNWSNCRVFFQIYEALRLIYTTELYSAKNLNELLINFGSGIKLKGDILIKAYERNDHTKILFSLQVRYTNEYYNRFGR